MNNLYKKNLEMTKKALKEAITKDFIIVQTIHTIDELIKIESKILANLRERIGYYAPRASRIEDSGELIKEISLLKQEDFGIDFTKDDLDSVKELIKITNEIKILMESQEKYMERLMEEVSPNLLKTAGSLIGARLISLAGTLKNLSEMPSSKIQVLGAEKALFRHLKEKTKAPKFGIIFSHESITTAVEKGKASRKLASEISKAVRIDYYGKFI